MRVSERLVLERASFHLSHLVAGSRSFRVFVCCVGCWVVWFAVVCCLSIRLPAFCASNFISIAKYT